MSEPWGGSVYAHREALFYAEPGAGWGVRDVGEADADPLTPRCLEWVRDFTAMLAPAVSGAYPNVPVAGDEPWARQYWGPNVDDLVSVKSAYDAEDVFRHPQSIPVV